MGLDLDIARLDVLTAILAPGGEFESEADEEPMVGTIASRLGIDPSRASRLVSDLIASGYARRAVSQRDARRVPAPSAPPRACPDARSGSMATNNEPRAGKWTTHCTKPSPDAAERAMRLPTPTTVLSLLRILNNSVLKPFSAAKSGHARPSGTDVAEPGEPDMIRSPGSLMLNTSVFPPFVCTVILEGTRCWSTTGMK
jgi:hypothetical protein